MLVRVMKGADSTFYVVLLIPQSHEPTFSVDNEAVPIIQNILGLKALILELELACQSIRRTEISSFYYAFYGHEYF